MKYFIVSSGYNCLELAKKCYESLCKIDFPGEWKAVLCSDGSTDGTDKWLYDNVKHPNISVQLRVDNKGAACRRHEIIMDAGLNDEDVIIFLGLDDELFIHTLGVIDEKYRSSGCWMTYGNWVDQHGTGLPRRFNLDFSQEIHDARDYRQDIYRSTAPNTFKYFLYKQIPVEDLKIKGEWINSTTESEVMYSCLEMCGQKRIGIIRDRIYRYNKNLPNGTLQRLGTEYKYKLLDIIRARPKRNLYER